MPRSDSTPVTRSRTRWHRFTLTRLPEPSVLAPIGTDLAESSWGGPSSFGSSPQLRCPHRSHRCTEVHPKAPSVPGRLADPLAGCGLPRALRSCQQVSVSAATRRRRRPGLTRRPPRLPVTFADPSLPPTSRRSPTARSGVAVNTVRVPTPLPPRERCGLGRSPPPHRSGWRALSGTSISKYPAKPQVKRYFQIHRVIP